MLSRTILLSLVASTAYAYPREWITNADGNVTDYVVPRAKLAADCNVDTDGAYTCVSVSQDVTRINSFCNEDGHVSAFTNVFDRRDEACDDIHCRTDKPVTLQTVDWGCNGITLVMTLDGNYLDANGKNAFYEITRNSFDGANKYGSLGITPECTGNPTIAPDYRDACWDSGPTNIQVSTFGGPYSGQFMETSLSIIVEDTPNPCDFILGDVLGAAGRLSPEAAGALGAVSGICGV